MGHVIPKHLLLMCVGVWLCSQIAVSAVESRGALNLGRVGGVFTVADFKAVNGVSQAVGWFTADVTDTTGTNQVGTFTNFPLRVPVSGILSADSIDAGMISDPIMLPQLSTNTCTLLGVVVGAVDVTVPGLGLNLHVNEISLVARGDRETSIGDLLCRVLGDQGAFALSGPAPQSLTEAAPQKEMTVDQLRGLTSILLGPGVAGATDTGSVQSGSALSGNTFPQTIAEPTAGLLQNILERTIQALQPPKDSQPASPTVP